MPSNHPFTVCSTEAHVADSLETLRNAPVLFLDCEGRDLGCQGGALSLLTIGTQNYSEVFVYDVVLLDHASLLPVLSLLARPDVLKVVWDGRMDSCELYYTYGTKLERVLDLQIAEVMSRVKRGEPDWRRLSRLGSYFQSYTVHANRSEYDGLQSIIGLQRCLQENSLALSDRKDASVTKIHHTDQWLTRPLTDQLLTYAAKDVYFIHLIWDHFSKMKYLEDLPTLLAQSQRYVSIHADVGFRPVHGDHFRGSPVLPLDILQEPTSDTYKCAACHRQLSTRCFNVRMARHRFLQRSMVCKVCQVIGKRNHVTEHEGWVQA